VTVVDGAFHVILGAPGGIEIPGAAVNDIRFAFTEPNRFLGLTLTRLGDGSAIASANQREILPRQQILSAPFALRAASADVADTVLPGAITAESIQTNAVTSNALANGAVTFPKLAPLTIGTNVGVGGLAVSFPTPDITLSSMSWENVVNLEVTVETTGRPVEVFLGSGAGPGDTQDELSWIKASYAASCCTSVCYLRILNGESSRQVFWLGSDATAPVFYPPASLRMIDSPPAGRHTYRVQASMSHSSTRMEFRHVRLFAREL
jgi:hypothetical protein